MKATTQRHGRRAHRFQEKSGANGNSSVAARRNVFATTGGGDEILVRGLCDSFGITQDALTRLTGFSPRAVAHWANGRAPGAAGQKRLIELRRLFDALSKMVDGKGIGGWLKRANPAF